MSHLGEALRVFTCGPGAHVSSDVVCRACYKDTALGCCGFCNCCGSDEYVEASLAGETVITAACGQCLEALRAGDDAGGWTFVAVAVRPVDDP